MDNRHSDRSQLIYYQLVRDSKRRSKDLIEDDIKRKKRLELQVPFDLLLAIVLVVMYQGEQLHAWVAAITVPILIGCSIINARSIRRYTQRIARAEEIPDSLKKEGS